MDTIQGKVLSLGEQKRTRSTTVAMLKVGPHMLRTRGLSDLSVEALCSEVGASVGDFYSRFESKETYFATLVEIAARDAYRRMSRLAQAPPDVDTSLAKLCRHFMNELIRWVRSHEGVLRAALQHDGTRPDRWTTFKALGRAYAAYAAPRLLEIMGSRRLDAKKKSVAFGFQVAVGTLINTVLYDPGPLSIHDREIEDRLSKCLFLLLRAEMNGPERDVGASSSWRRRRAAGTHASEDE